MYNRKSIISLSLEEKEGEKGEVGDMVQYLGAKQEHNSSTPKCMATVIIQPNIEIRNCGRVQKLFVKIFRPVFKMKNHGSHQFYNSCWIKKFGSPLCISMNSNLILSKLRR